MAEATNKLDLLWGASAIAAAIGKTERAVYHMLEQGRLPARKVGASWVASREALRRHFEGEAT